MKGKINNKPICPACNQILTYHSTNLYQDLDIEGEGVVLVTTCSDKECKVEFVEIYIKSDNED